MSSKTHLLFCELNKVDYVEKTNRSRNNKTNKKTIIIAVIKTSK